MYKKAQLPIDNGCPTCGTWKKHWEKWQGTEMLADCSNKNCSSPIFPIYGSRIIKSDIEKSHQWIIPLCSKCNDSSNLEPIEIKDENLKVSYDNCYYQEMSPKVRQLQKNLEDIIAHDSDGEVKELVSKFNKDIDFLIKK